MALRAGVFIAAVVLALLALHATLAHAEPLAIPLGVYATAAAADLHSTYRFLQIEGHHERNPFVKGLSNQPGKLVGVSAALDAATVYGVYRLVNLKVFGGPHPRFTRIALYAAAGVRVLYALDNYSAQGPPRPR